MDEKKLALVVKMNGSAAEPESPENRFILSWSDFEEYDLDRPRTRQEFMADLQRRVMICLGTSLNDPNLKQMSSYTTRSGRGRRGEQLVVLRADEDQRRRLEARDLAARGFNVQWIDDHAEVEWILELLCFWSVKPKVWLSGNDRDDQSDAERAALRLFVKHLASWLIRRSLRIIHGESHGLTQSILAGAADVCGEMGIHPKHWLTRYSRRLTIADIFDENTGVFRRRGKERLERFLAQTGDFVVIDGDAATSTEGRYDAVREAMARASSLAIFVSGSRGTHEEFAYGQKHVPCIPLPFFGGAASEIYKQRLKFCGRALLDKAIRPHIDALAGIKAATLSEPELSALASEVASLAMRVALFDLGDVRR